MLRFISKKKEQKRGLKYVAIVALTLGLLIGAVSTVHAWSFVSTSGCHGNWRSSARPLVSETVANIPGCEGHATAWGAFRVESGWRRQGVLARAESPRTGNGTNSTFWNLRR